MKKINTIIIPCIRSDFIGKCLETLYENSPDNFYVYVIDQTPDNSAYLNYHDRTHFWIRPYRNLGFSKAMNTGILLSNTPYISLCNDDLEFIDKRWWQGILDTFESDPNILAVNPMSPKEGSWGYGLRDDNKSTWQPPDEYVTDQTLESVYPKMPSGEGIYTPQEARKQYDFLLDGHKRYRKNTMVDAIAGWFVTWKRSGLEELGLYDEKFYPGGGEDYDMNCRAYSCAYPEPREVCDPKYHRRLVSTSRSWIWHHWGKSKDALSAKNPNDTLFSSRERWNDNSELWGPYFDVWGHENMPDGSKKPLKRLKPVTVDSL